VVTKRHTPTGTDDSSEVLSNQGTRVPAVFFRTAAGGICEVRTSLAQNRIARVLFYIAKKGRMVLLHRFIKKTPRTPDEDLALAKKTKASSKGNCNESKKASQENNPHRIHVR
jgi:phage-related protein